MEGEVEVWEEVDSEVVDGKNVRLLGCKWAMHWYITRESLVTMSQSLWPLFFNAWWDCHASTLAANSVLYLCEVCNKRCFPMKMMLSSLELPA